jgi:hypothetical protein
LSFSEFPGSVVLNPITDHEFPFILKESAEVIARKSGACFKGWQTTTAMEAYNSEAKPGEKKHGEVYEKHKVKKKRDYPSPEASPVFKSRLRNDYSRMKVARIPRVRNPTTAMAHPHWAKARPEIVRQHILFFYLILKTITAIRSYRAVSSHARAV